MKGMSLSSQYTSATNRVARVGNHANFERMVQEEPTAIGVVILVHRQTDLPQV